MGFVPKRSSNAELFEALRMVMSGGLYVPTGADAGGLPMPAPDRAVPDHVAERRDASARGQAGRRTRGLPRTGLAPTPPLATLGLTPRQDDVLALLLQGKPNKLIARELNVSVETVKDHVAAVLRALGVSSRTQAVLAVSQMQQQAAWRIAAPPAAEARPERHCAGCDAASRPEQPCHGLLPATGFDVRCRRGAGPDLSALPDEVQAAYDYLPATLTGNAAGADASPGCSGRSAPRVPLWAWLACLPASGALRLAALPGSRRSATADADAMGRAGAHWAHGCTLASGFDVGPGRCGCSRAAANAFSRPALMLVVFTFCVASVQLLATQQRLFISLPGACRMPLIVRIATCRRQLQHCSLPACWA